MRKAILMLAFALATWTMCNAQQIEMVKVRGGYMFMQNGNPMPMDEVLRSMESHQPSLDLMKKYKSNNSAASIFSSIGGFLIGWPIGTAIGGGDPEWAMAAVGAGIAVISIPFATGARKNAEKAVDLYNASLNTTSFYRYRPEYKVIANGNGIGVSMVF